MSATTPEARRIYPGLDQLALRTLVVLGAATAVVAAQARAHESDRGSRGSCSSWR